jgi:hypothetical protein
LISNSLGVFIATIVPFTIVPAGAGVLADAAIATLDAVSEDAQLPLPVLVA